MQAFLKVLLGLSGLGVVVLGINVGFGGISTLGWQLPRDFIAVIDEPTFVTQDSHVRFLGGVFGAIGLVLALGARWTDELRQTLITLCFIMAVGGLVRFSAGFQDVILNPALYASLLLELFLFPFMAILLWRFGPGSKGFKSRVADQE